MRKKKAERLKITEIVHTYRNEHTYFQKIFKGRKK